MCPFLFEFLNIKSICSDINNVSCHVCFACICLSISHSFFPLNLTFLICKMTITKCTLLFVKIKEDNGWRSVCKPQRITHLSGIVSPATRPHLNCCCLTSIDSTARIRSTLSISISSYHLSTYLSIIYHLFIFLFNHPD